MKKITFIILISLICICLAACDPSHFTYMRHKPVDELVNVELIEYKNSNVALISNLYSNREIKRFDFSKVIVIETLNADAHEDFINSLSEYVLWNHWWQPDSPSEMCLRLIYENGDFDVISYANPNGNGYYNRFNSQGKLVKYIGSLTSRDNFVEIVNAYFTNQIE